MIPAETGYRPSVADVLAVKDDVAHLSPHLPPNIINLITDFAGYWPRMLTEISGAFVAAQGRRWEHTFVMRFKPLCILACEESPASTSSSYWIHARPLSETSLEFPARCIVWAITSHDHGFCDEASHTKGTYIHSYTGFNVGVERYHPASISTTPFHSHSLDAYLSAWPGATTCTDPGEPPASDWPSHSKREYFGLPVEHPNMAHYAMPNPPVWLRKGWSNGDMCLQNNVQAKEGSMKHVIVYDWTDDIDPES